jgi:hypothetical protein
MRQNEAQPPTTSSSSSPTASSLRVHLFTSHSDSAAPVGHPHELRLRNTNQGEEEVENHKAIQPAQTPSKYVSRLRKFSAASPDNEITDSGKISVFTPKIKGSEAHLNNYHHTPHSAASEKSRVNALLRSADEGEDFSPDDHELRLSIDSAGGAGLNNCESHNNNLEESIDFADPDEMAKRLRRKPTRRKSKTGEEASNTSAAEFAAAATIASTAEVDALAFAVSHNCSLAGLNSSIVLRLMASEKEARAAWGKYLKLNDSVITDIFAGQLQSTIECLTCHHR